MAITSPRASYTGFRIDAVQPDAPLSGDRHITNGCPLHGGSAITLELCRKCQYFGGMIDTGNAGPNQRWRVSCHGPTKRGLVRLGVKEARVHCPLVSFKLRNVKDCQDCPQFRGIKRSPRGLWERFTGRGIPSVLCAHPATRRVEEIV